MAYPRYPATANACPNVWVQGAVVIRLHHIRVVHSTAHGSLQQGQVCLSSTQPIGAALLIGIPSSSCCALLDFLIQVERFDLLFFLAKLIIVLQNLSVLNNQHVALNSEIHTRRKLLPHSKPQPSDAIHQWKVGALSFAA